MVFEPGGAEEHENENDSEPLLGLGEDEQIEKAFHRLA
jgi:hypothetical protein